MLVPLIILLAAEVTSGAQGSQVTVPGKKVVKVDILQPAPDSERISSTLRATVGELSDGNKFISISGQGTEKNNSPPLLYRITIDLRQNTYKITRLKISDLPGGLFLRNSILAIAPGTYYASVALATQDLPQITLAYTNNYLSWRVNSNGSVSYVADRNDCWAANPSPLGTHWYISSCYENLWNDGRLNHFVNANYYNHDFGLKNLATYVWHTSTIRGRNDGWFEYHWNYNHWGEFSWLLDIDVYINGYKIR